MSDRVVCENCGYSNSKFRRTCKSCREELPHIVETSADALDIVDSKAVATIPNQNLSSGQSLLRKFLNEEQDPNVVQKVVEKVTTILTSTEEILYIAVQKKPIVTISPDCVVITNRRFIYYEPKMLGRVNFEDYIWRDLKNVTLQEKIMGAVISFETIRNEYIEIDYLPKQQARIIYSISQEMEEMVREERRQRGMEEKRAAAGGVFIQNPSSEETKSQTGNSDDPVKKLAQIKTMLDAELITEEEYQQKKMQILNNL